jgi:predicted 3-demethylubiquinone-9 3-methyltransferase (glyoxalase superfamily)
MTRSTTTPCLWFTNEGEQAAEYYTGIFPNSRILEVTRYGPSGPGPEGSVMTVSFELDRTEFMALNGGQADFSFNEAISFVIHCANQGEVDRYWERLSENGEEGPCGWLKDRYGVSWQVVPDGLTDLLRDPDPGRAGRAMQAMLGMKKIDMAEIERAANSGDTA